MCVIAIKPTNVKISKHTIQLMYEANPHGAGFGIVRADHTLVSKGYFSVEELWKDINKLQKEELVIHFRWATHGSKTAEMCHPFVVVTDEADATCCQGEITDPVFFHNGIINGYGNKSISDTCDFAMNVLARLPSVDDMNLLLTHISSAFVITHNGNVHVTGDFEEYKGLQVSNTFFDWMFNNESPLHSRKISPSNNHRISDCPILSEPTDCFNHWFDDIRCRESDKASKPEALKAIPKRVRKYS